MKMVWINNWLSLASFIVTLFVGANCAPAFIISELANKYLSMPHQEVTTDMDRLDSIQKVLVRVNLGNATEPDAVLKGFKTLMAHVETESTDRNPLIDAMIMEFIDLAQADGICREYLSLWFLGRFQEIEVSKIIAKPRALLDYMKYFGSKKFHSCALTAKDELKSRLANHEQDLKELYSFFQALFLSHNATDEETYNELKKIDATSVKWNVDQATLLADGESKLKAPVESLIDLKFENNCAKLNKNFRPLLDVINLAAVLNVDFDYFEDDFTVKKLNEASRICLRRDQQPSRYRENLRNQLGIFTGEASSSGTKGELIEQVIK